MRSHAGARERSNDWEIREGSNVPITEHMPSWDKCPGCGVGMSELTLILVIRRHEK